MHPNTRFMFAFIFGILILAAGILQAQEKELTASFDNPSDPGTVSIKWNNGDIRIIAHDENEVRVIPKRNRRRYYRYDRYDRSRGLNKVYEAEEITVVKEGDNIRVNGKTRYRHRDAEIYVPANAKLYVVNTLNGGIEITGFRNGVETETLNGNIILEDVTGPVNAYSTNGEIIADVMRTNSDDEMVFTTLNSDIDIALPPQMQANLYMTTRDEIYTDFDIVKLSEGSEKWRSRHRDKQIYSINGGGSEITMKTLHGSIYVRKQK